MNTNHQGKIKATIAKITRTREFLDELRTELMKNYALGKTTSIRDIIVKKGMNTMTATWVTEAGAIKDCSPEGTARSGPKLYKWVYDKTENGRVDQYIIDKVIECERNYFRANAEKKNLLKGIEEEKPVKESMKKLPTGTGVSIEAIISWIDDELTKEQVIPGYLRSTQKKMYETIKETVGNLKPSLEMLKTAIDAINL